MLVKTDTSNSNPQVSAVIVSYNSGPYLIECIRTVLPQASEILVVDNASSDASLELCKLHFPNEPKLIIINNLSNVGFSVACNIGAMESTGDFLFFLNPDCKLDDTVVSNLKQVLISKDSVGMVGGLLVNPDGSEQGGGRRAVPTPWRSFVRAFGLNHFAKRWPKLFFDFNLHQQPLPDQPIEVEAISGACMLVKRSAMNDVGLWDEGYFLHCEDLDWCMRFRKKDWKIMFVPTAVVTHELGISSQKRPVFVAWHKHKGMIRFYRKFFRHQYPGILMGMVIIGVWLRFSIIIAHSTAQRLFRARHG